MRLGLRIEVERVEDNTLTRFEMKARRIIDQRNVKGSNENGVSV